MNFIGRIYEIVGEKIYNNDVTPFAVSNDQKKKYVPHSLSPFLLFLYLIYF